MIHVDDLVEALVTAAVSPAASGRCYYLSDGSTHTRESIAATFRKVTGKGFALQVPVVIMKTAGVLCDTFTSLTGRPLILNSDKVSESIQAGWVCNGDRIRHETGFTPQISSEEGFRSTYRWYLDHS